MTEPLQPQQYRVVSYDPPSPVVPKKRQCEVAISSLTQHHIASTFVHYEVPRRSPVMLPEVLGLQMTNCEGPLHPTSACSAVTSPGPPRIVPGTAALAAIASSLQQSIAQLELESHDTHIKKAKLDQGDKQTGSSYDHHVQNYIKYWTAFQAERHQKAPEEVPVPAFPITTLKTFFFLEYEMSREKRRYGKNDTIAGSNVGKLHISQVISALESWWHNNTYLYKDDPDAQLSLRSDIRVRTAESSAKHQELKRINKVQALKAVGSSGDTYTPEELKRCSIWCLSDISGSKQVWLSLGDRAMLLLSSTMAFHGESSRILEWSDLFMSSIPMDDVRIGYRVPVLAALADNAKHNQQGHLDEHGAIRHREVELCPVGGLALLFFGFFHVLHLPLPDLLPDFDDMACGEYGHHDWYAYHVFWGKQPAAPMSYDNHRDRLRGIHKENEISITKVTHAGRSYAAQTAQAHGATVSGTKALGGWNENGSFRQCYK
ncbi:hypothetical protein SCP_0406590 [Sparassis crispa]|uniref:Ndc10 domain-containing protein n=1 Tax=Sparassis crispa TaxID=139825 RepID=A0A401GJD9_9APHY|nr:hypothetical protein SCP_0406590 [Sparassis crispa]GBE82275.1 hypothetical protein SCP_0406590 [Sparassis crispa]